MKYSAFLNKIDIGLIVGIIVLIAISIITLRSIAPSVFPVYFIYLTIALLAFFVFSKISFDILSLFSWHLYIFSLLFLIAPLVIGQVTRGTVRWIPVGSLTIQPAEIVRPFLLVFFAHLLTSERVNLKRFMKIIILVAIPVALIFIQPSLGVTILTLIGFFGVLLASGVERKYIVLPVVVGILSLPLVWFLLASWQQDRVLVYFSPASDPTGPGYNSLQSMISVGSGKLFGRGLGQGVQTQLAFLPERHTDFIFASIAEEMGFAGAGLLLSALFFVLYRIAKSLDFAKNHTSRAFLSGVFLTLFAQTIIHIGMNMGLFPVTGLPLPLVSAGGSSLVATMITLGMVMGARK